MMSAMSLDEKPKSSRRTSHIITFAERLDARVDGRRILASNFLVCHERGSVADLTNIQPEILMPILCLPFDQGFPPAGGGKNRKYKTFAAKNPAAILKTVTNTRLLLLVCAWPARPSTTSSSRFLWGRSRRASGASATRTPIAEEESRSGCDSGRNTLCIR